MRLICSSVVIAMTLFPSAATAQELVRGARDGPVPPLMLPSPSFDFPDRTLSLPTPVALQAQRMPAPRPAQAQRDSLKNGAVIGAVIGAAAMGAFGGWLCYAMHEPGTGSCWPDALRISALGAAIGLGAGIGVDAAMSRTSSSVRLTARF